MNWHIRKRATMVGALAFILGCSPNPSTTEADASRDSSVETPLTLTADERHDHAVQELRKNGAKVTEDDSEETTYYIVEVDQNWKGGTEGLSHLSSIRNLHTVIAADNAVADAGLAQIADSQDVRSLSLHACQVTDAGMKRIARLRDLEWLVITRCPISDDGVKHIKQLTRLTVLCLDHTEVTDAALVYIRELPQLSGLRLYSTAITDSGLEHLATLRKLKVLGISETNVTDEGVTKIRSRLPDCHVIHDLADVEQ